ncbi:alpha-amylase family protein [Phytoactinopolyspora endophytica]|uniref:alpha-amylase family protein n=1 Tax=Phytoactinopolyspora endophytica TaxID=1642495 RepID=UPI0013ED3889|nr:alpha-amylase family protein [Phytoactinopolyspora endophytica]
MSTTPDETPSTAKWWNYPFAVFQTNLQEIDASLDVEAALDAIEAHGANAWLLNTGGIISNFPTELPFQTRNPHLAERPSGDLVGDAVEAAHQRGIRVLARFDLSKVSAPIAAAHPEWCFRTHDGEPQVYNDLWSMCPSAGYYQERSFDIIDEVLDRYPIDGVFFNWFNFNIIDYSRKLYGVCHCTACVRRYRQWSHGKSLPVDTRSPEIRTWSRFTAEVLADLNTRITAHIHTRAEDVLVVLGKQADMRYAESNKMFGRDLWPHTTGEDVSELHHHEPPVPALVNSVSFVDMPYRMAGEEPSHFAQYLIQGIARGGMPSTYIMGAPGRIPYPSLEAAGEITRFFRRHEEDVYGRLAPASRIALVKAPPAQLGSAASEEYHGTYSMLQRAQRPFDVVPLDQIAQLQAAGRLARFDLLVIPDVGALGSQAAALDAYVRDGGNVLTTGASGFTEDGTAELRTSPAHARVGDVRCGQDLWSTYATLAPQDHAASHHFDAPIVPVLGKLHDCAWAVGALRHGVMLPPAPFGPPEKAYGHIPSKEPAYGSLPDPSGGSVTVLPWTIGQSYREIETTPPQEMFLRIVDATAPPRLRFDAPENVEVIVGTAGDHLVIHLVNLTGASRRGFRPPVAVTGVRVMLPQTARDPRADALVAGVPLDAGVDGVLELGTLHDFEVLRIRGAASIA